MQQLPLLDEEVAFAASRPRVLVLACGAIAREVLALVRLNGWEHVELRCLPAKLHSTPRAIPAAVDRKLGELAGRYESVFVGYADCGTAGALDRVLAEHGAERIPGAHCYGFLAGNDAWDAMQEAEPGTYYLTDFLARHFDALVWRPLGLDRHPDLLAPIFGNYTRLVYLAQSDDPDLDARARSAAARLGLRFERVQTGYGDLAPALDRFVAAAGTGVRSCTLHEGLVRPAPDPSGVQRARPDPGVAHEGPLRPAPDPPGVHRARPDPGVAAR